MEIHSLYNCMNEDANNIPDNVNIKMIIRHSFRKHLTGNKDSETMRLNEYGILKASEFGKSIDYPFGELYTSRIERCIQTVYYMTNGKRDIKVAANYLTQVFTYDKHLADIQIKLRDSLKKTVVDLKNGISIPGFYPIENIVKKILDFIFQTGNKEHTIDIYCTHDFQIGMMIALLFECADTAETLKKNWPKMLEGMFLWGSRDSFYCAWRGKTKHFDNFLTNQIK